MLYAHVHPGRCTYAMNYDWRLAGADANMVQSMRHLSELEEKMDIQSLNVL